MSLLVYSATLFLDCVIARLRPIADGMIRLPGEPWRPRAFQAREAIAQLECARFYCERWAS